MSQKSKTSRLGYIRNGMVNNSETLSVLYFTFTAGARGEGDRYVWGGGREQGQSQTSPEPCKKTCSERCWRGGFFSASPSPKLSHRSR